MVGLKFNGPVNTVKVISSMSVYLTTLFLGRLGPLAKPLTSACAHSFARIWHLSFLYQQKGENDNRNYFMINLQKRMLPDLQPPDHQSDSHPTQPPRHTPQCVLRRIREKYPRTIIKYSYLSPLVLNPFIIGDQQSYRCKQCRTRWYGS